MENWSDLEEFDLMPRREGNANLIRAGRKSQINRLRQTRHDPEKQLRRKLNIRRKIKPITLAGKGS